MSYDEIILLALALAVDALVVTFSFGLVLKEHRLCNAFGLGVATGFGQFIMPLIGFMLTGAIFIYVEQWDHWIAFLVFLCLGMKVIWEAFNKNEEEQADIPKKLSFKVLLLTGIATSIDALVAGGSLYLTQHGECANDSAQVNILIASLIIGFVTFVCAFGGFLSAGRLHKLPSKYLEIGAGLVLIGLGVKILLEHTNCL